MEATSVKMTITDKNNFPVSEDVQMWVVFNLFRFSKAAKQYMNEETLKASNVYWQDNELDMCKLSAMFPSYIFTLTCYCEDYNEKWLEYYVNGKYQRAREIVSFEPMSAELLAAVESLSN